MRRQALQHRGYTLIEIAVVVAIIAILLALVLPNLTRSTAQGRLSACKTNLRNLVSGIELYAMDNGSLPPPSLGTLVPTYVAALPVCPATGLDSYSPGYVSVNYPTNYTIMCAGTGHVGIYYRPDYPQYAFGQGIIEP
jgi:prepilin-type N-terminal cleavage/methylation domain-containing protein